jgi:hypothetical protein
MPINSRFGRPSTIVVPAGESSVGARGVGARDGLAEFQKYIKQAGIDKKNKELLRQVYKTAGLKDEQLDNMSSANLEAAAQSVVDSNIKIGIDKIERAKQGKAAQKALSNFQASKERDIERVDTPLDLQFGPGLKSPQTILDVLGGALSHREGAIKDGSGSADIRLEKQTRPVPIDKSTINVGTAGESIPRLSGVELLADVLKGRAGLDERTISALEDSGIDPLTGSESVRAQDTTNPFFNRLVTLAGAPTVSNINVDGKNLVVQTDQVSGQKTTSFAKASDARNFKPVKLPDGTIGLGITDVNGKTIIAMTGDGEDKKPTRPAALVRRVMNIIPKKTLTELEDAYFENFDQLQGLKEVQRNFYVNPDLLTSSVRAKAWGAEILDNMGVLSDGNIVGQTIGQLADFISPGATGRARDLIEEKVTLFQSAEREFLQWRKYITGVAGGEKEFSEIRKSFLDVGGQGPKQFKTSLDNLISLKLRTLETHRRILDIAQKEGWTVSKFQAAFRREIRKDLKNRGPEFLLGAKPKSAAAPVTKRNVGAMTNQQLSGALEDLPESD